MDPSNNIKRAEEGVEKISMEAMMINSMQITNFRTLVVGIVCGIICGILGLTSLHGLLFYVISSLVTDLILIVVKMNMNCRKYTNNIMPYFLLEGISNSAMSFVLFWTLSFAIVYIY